MADYAATMVFHGPNAPLEARRIELPRLAEGEVLARVKCCTLCGSDLHTHQGRRQTACPTILGHEILGEVAALPAGGAGDVFGRSLQIGERVTWSLAASCGNCRLCQLGIPQKCSRLFKFGHQPLEGRVLLSGGLAEFCHLPKGAAIVPVPAALPDLVACPANCAAATVCAALRAAGDVAGRSLLIFGAGMLGLTAAAFARHLGASEVIVCDIDRQRLPWAEKFGATRVVPVDRAGDDLKRVVEQVTDSQGVDAALELCGAAAALEMALQNLRIAGRCVLVGAVFPGPPAPLDMETVVRRLLRIEGVHNYAPPDLVRAVELLAATHDQFPYAELTPRRFALAEANAAFKCAIEERPHRVAVTPDG